MTWVDDSKATNPHAAGSSLAAYPGWAGARAGSRGARRSGSRTNR
ncbi:hypothetical protein [Microbacterium sp. B19]|nr:hypothetical protein [Microbacterium sp. B19]